MKLISNPIVKGVLKSIPLVGDVVDNITIETQDSPAGSLNSVDLVSRMIRLAVLVVLMYLVLSGKIGMEDAEEAKQFITD